MNGIKIILEKSVVSASTVRTALFMNLVIRYDYIVTNRRIEGKISPNSFDIYEGITNLDIAK